MRRDNLIVKGTGITYCGWCYREVDNCICPDVKACNSATHNAVNSPEHYKNSSIECIDAIEASMNIDEFKGMLKGNVMKYLWRYTYKGKPVEDLKKAKWYLERLINFLERKTDGI